jgi:ATP phosphoribosyltransferase
VPAILEVVYFTLITLQKQHLFCPAAAPLQLGGSGVLVQPMTYIFDEEPERWRTLLKRLGLEEKDVV